jgi:hypothetical protein
MPRPAGDGSLMVSGACDLAWHQLGQADGIMIDPHVNLLRQTDVLLRVIPLGQAHPCCH